MWPTRPYFAVEQVVPEHLQFSTVEVTANVVTNWFNLYALFGFEITSFMFVQQFLSCLSVP